MERVEDDAFVVRSEDDEEEARTKELHLRKSERVAPPGPGAQRAPPPLLEACGFEHVSVATALAAATSRAREDTSIGRRGAGGRGLI